MSKAITGVAELAGAAALGGLAYLTGGAALAIPGYAQAMSTLAISGIATEVGAIADALTSNRGINITDRRPASNRQIVYGTQMVGGTLIYESVTGHQYNQVIMIAGHQIDSIQAIYLDGRKVYFKGSGSGWTVRNGVGFGGDADSNDHLGPDGLTHYNFGSHVYVEARYGDQTFGDYMQSLAAQDTTNNPWGPQANGDCPSLVGCAYIYLKCVASSTLFPQRPEVRILINGKNDIYDPRTGTRGFTNNAALVLADVISDTQFGLGDSSINTAQLIAAANICDEQVPTAALNGATESRYCCDYTYDTGTAPADAMQTMLEGIAGRLSYVGGEWFLFPGGYIAPTLSFDDSALTGAPQWNSCRSYRDLPNRVTGTHISAEYPYSVAGTYYQRPNTGTQNNFDLKFTQSNYPYYATDELHGYPNNQFLTEDGNHIRPMDLSLPTVLSITQCQRVAKINLMRARARQGHGTLEMGLQAYKLQPCDTFNMSSTALGGWSNKVLEVIGTTLHVQKATTEDGSEVNEIRYSVNVQETDPSIYAWSTSEELTVYASPASPSQAPAVPNPPTNMQLESGANTAFTSSDGILVAVIQVTWDTPLDPLATAIQIQYAAAGSGSWQPAPFVDISLNVGLISTVSAGSSYDVRIRTVRANGSASDWVTQNNFLVPALSGNLGALAASLNVTGGWIGKWWRISSSTIPANGGELTTPTLFVTQGGIVNFVLNDSESGAANYQFARCIEVPAPSDGQGLPWIYARFTCNFTAQSTGTYTFGVNSDDGARMVVNNQELFNTLSAGHVANADLVYTNSATIDLVSGTSYPVVVEFSNGALSGAIQALYTVPGGSSPQLLDLGTTYRDAGSVTYSNGQTAQDLQGNAAAGASENLIPNGNFVLGSIQGWSDHNGGTPVGWTLGSDSYGLRVYSAPNNPTGGLGFVSPTFSVIPGQKYRVTYRDYSPNGAGGIWYRIFYSANYTKNICTVTPGINNYDFLANWAISSPAPRSDPFDWTCPDGIHYASLAVYNTGAGDLSVQYLSCVPYAGVGQWGADITGNNTSNDTSFVSGVPSSVIASVVPTGYKLIINNGNKTYSIEAI